MSSASAAERLSYEKCYSILSAFEKQESDSKRKRPRLEEKKAPRRQDPPACEEVHRYFHKDAKSNPVIEGKTSPPLTPVAAKKPSPPKQRTVLYEDDIEQLVPECKFCQVPNTAEFTDQGIVCTECGHMLSTCCIADEYTTRRVFDSSSASTSHRGGGGSGSILREREALERMEQAAAATRTAEERRTAAVQRSIRELLSHFSREISPQQFNEAVEYALSKMKTCDCKTREAALASLKYVFANAKSKAALPLQQLMVKPIDAKLQARATSVFNAESKREQPPVVVKSLNARFISACLEDAEFVDDKAYASSLAENTALRGLYGKVALHIGDRLTESNYSQVAEALRGLASYALGIGGKEDWADSTLSGLLKDAVVDSALTVAVDSLLGNKLFLSEAEGADLRLMRARAILRAE